MNFSLLFENEDQINYGIVQKFIHQTSNEINIESLIEEFKLTPYKLNKALTSINNDLNLISDSEMGYLEIPNKNILVGHNITSKLSSRLAIIYLERSTLFTIFEYKFIYSTQYSKAQYMKKNFISTTVFYNGERQLNQILKSNDFEHPQNFIKDDEYVIRLRIFQIYYSAYNGIISPFNELDDAVVTISDFLKENFLFNNSPSQEIKLDIFIRIWMLRLMNNGFVHHHTFDFNFETQDYFSLFQPLIEIISDEIGVKISSFELEWAYSFLLSQGYLPLNNKYLANNQKGTEQARQMTSDLIDLIRQNTHLIRLRGFNWEALNHQLFTINFQLTTFYIEPTTFISKNQIDFFKETYPVFDKIIRQYLENVQNAGVINLSQSEEFNLYFSYIFAFITEITPQRSLDEIYICVDFSQGTLYNNYIKRTLQAFDNVSIVLEINLSDKTNIYLSDFEINIENSDIIQVTWQDPPLAGDWAELADIIIELKYKKMKTLLPDWK